MNTPSHDRGQPPIGDDLPPVQPPTLGFIIQLFVVPALIVLVVVAVWALFGRIALGEQDWRGLVRDLENPNPQVHKRAMFSLAGLLDVDRRLGNRGQHLSQQPEIADALARHLDKLLKQPDSQHETLSLLVYLTRALGLLDVPEITLPVLAKAMQPEFDTEIRKGAITSWAMIAGRAWERGKPLSSVAVSAPLQLSFDSDPTLRRPAAFSLGLIDAPESRDRLLTLLEDQDLMTAVNAAVALARLKSTQGLSVYRRLLVEKTTPPAVSEADAQTWPLMQRNVLKAVAMLGPSWSTSERQELISIIQRLAEHHPEPAIRVESQATLIALSSPH